MQAIDSYVAERQAERRRRMRSGIAGVGLLMALGFGLLLSYPMPADLLSTAGNTSERPAVASSTATEIVATALR